MSWQDKQEIVGRVTKVIYHLRRTKTLLVELEDHQVVPVVPSRYDLQFLRGSLEGKRLEAYGYYDPWTQVWRATRTLIAIQPIAQEPLFPSAPLVYIDSHEVIESEKVKNSDVQHIVTRLKDQSFEVRVTALDAGDYLLSDRLIVERKTVDDFHASISDGRFFDQMETLASLCEIPLLVIYGDQYASRTQPEVFEGVLSWALTSDDTPPNLRIIQKPDLLSVINLFIRIIKREQVERKHYPSLKEAWKAETLQLQQLKVVSAYESIGLKKARKLLKAQRTIERIASSDVKELAHIIGGHSARKVVGISKTPYKEE